MYSASPSHTLRSVYRIMGIVCLVIGTYTTAFGVQCYDRCLNHGCYRTATRFWHVSEDESCPIAMRLEDDNGRICSGTGSIVDIIEDADAEGECTAPGAIPAYAHGCGTPEPISPLKY
jgi:hypothetical protein